MTNPQTTGTDVAEKSTGAEAEAPARGGAAWRERVGQGLQQFLAFSGQWQALLMVVVVIAVAFVLYVPFVLVSNKQYEREQAEAAKIEA